MADTIPCVSPESVTFCLITTGNRLVTRQCLRSLDEYAGNCNFLIVDNALSELDGTRDEVKMFTRTHAATLIAMDETLTHANGMNKIVEQPHITPWLIFLHNDTVLLSSRWPGFFRQLILHRESNAKESRRVGFVGEVWRMHASKIGDRIILPVPTFRFTLMRTSIFGAGGPRFQNRTSFAHGDWRFVMDDTSSFWIDYLRKEQSDNLCHVKLTDGMRHRIYTHLGCGTAWIAALQKDIVIDRTKPASYWREIRKQTRR